MKLIYQGHACFTLESDEGTIVFDPYDNGSIPGLNDLNVAGDVILCSHEHFDHNARHVVKQTRRLTNFNIKEIKCFHDDQKGSLRGHNIIHIVETEGMRVAHLGDLGHLLDDYSELLNVDVLMIPVGGHYTIDALTARKIVEEVKPRIVIPMHYRGDGFGFDVIGTVFDFLDGLDYIDYNDCTLEITKETKQQVAYLKQNNDSSKC